MGNGCGKVYGGRNPFVTREQSRKAKKAGEHHSPAFESRVAHGRKPQVGALKRSTRNAAASLPCEHYRMSPRTLNVVTDSGIPLPLRANALRAAISRPPQHGTSMRHTVIERMSFDSMMACSFSE